MPVNDRHERIFRLLHIGLALEKPVDQLQVPPGFRRAGIDVVAGRHQLEVRIDFLERQPAAQFRADFPVELLDALGENVLRPFAPFDGLRRPLI